jgi:predicted Rossmann-fold nucleotide-binding protein
MDEFFEVATLIQTRKMSPVPLILVGSGYWSGLLDWMKKTMLECAGNISNQDLDLLRVADTADEVAEHVLQFYSKNALQPNF